MTFSLPIPFTLVPSLIFIALCVLPGSVILWIYKRQIARKKSPLTVDLLRNPGESLREQLQDIDDEILFIFWLMPVLGVLVYSAVITQYYLTGSQSAILGIVALAIMLVGVLYFSSKVFKLMKRRNHLRLGYDCELAVGQDVNTLMRDGFFVFHDFPADGFNIDHVLVGPTGVFAIETKGRAKVREAKNENWKLKYDGEKLIFPGWIEKKPIEQAKRQAHWLSGWLQKATGSPCNVVPVLAIPGWWIDRIAPGDIKVYNGKGSGFLAKGRTVLSSREIEAIAHQIDQKCRNVQPSSYQHERASGHQKS